MKRPTVHDVAKRASVSPSTVSNYFNGRQDRMTDATKERISNAITALGYRPNQAARHFRTGHSPFVALIVPTTANVFFGEMAYEIERQCRRAGYSCMLCSVTDDNGDELIQSMFDMGVAGVILAVSTISPLILEHFVAKGLPVVAVDEQHDDGLPDGVDFVSIDHRANVVMAFDHLVGLGHHAIAYVTDGGRSVFSRRSKLESFLDVRARLRLSHCPTIAPHNGQGAGFITAQYARIGEEAATILLREWRQVTAAVVFSDFVAPGLISGLARHGIAVPSDFSIVGIDGIAMGEILTPPLTSVREPLEKIAAVAVDRLVQRLQGKTLQREMLLIQPELLIRQSTAPRSDVVESADEAALMM
jgi:DNA-binding LacI/PurR family transcriptional regulator